jgi:hypothetical protein
MELKNGQLVMFVNDRGTVKALVAKSLFEGYEGMLEVPQGLGFVAEKIRVFMETEAAKYGLTVTEGSSSSFVFNIST